MSFFSELRRRNVLRVGIAYLAAVWVLLQVADTLLPVISAPSWVLQALVVSAALGFPLALVLAWFYEWTSEGIKATDDAASTETVKFTGRKLDFAIIGLLVIAIGFLLVGRLGSIDPSIAVLPFSNESAAEEENAAFFASGMHNELLTQLGKITSLTVIGPNSVMEYRESTKSTREIGRELDVATLVLGQVQLFGDMVRISVQLVDAQRNRQLWSDAYEDRLTAENIFRIQSEIATTIAGELNAALTPDEVSRLNERPPQSVQAWLHYQSGLEYMRNDDDENALQQFELAVQEDPMFAVAWARLAWLYGARHDLGDDLSEDLRASFLVKSLAALNTAQDLAPESPQVQLALSSHYARAGSRENALRALEMAARSMPNDPDLHQSRAQRYRRLGQWNDAIEAAERARDLDPRTYVGGAYWIYENLRNYTRVEEELDEILRIRPDASSAHASKVRLPLWRDGDITAAKAAAADSGVPLGRARPRIGWIAALYEGNYQDALRYANDIEEGYFGSGMYIPKQSFLGVTHQVFGNPEQAKPYFAAVEASLRTAMDKNDRDARYHVTLAEALFGLDEAEEAVRLANDAIELVPRSQDAVTGPDIQIDAIVRVLAPAGDVAAVIEQLRDYLDHPGGVWSLEGLLPDPRFDAVREHPDFQAFVESRRRR